MTKDAIKFWQAFVREMISIGGKNLPKSISSRLGAKLARYYKEKGLFSIEDGLKKCYKALEGTIYINRIDKNNLEITNEYAVKFCPIGGKYNPDPKRKELIRDSICIPYTIGFLNEMVPKYKFELEEKECILDSKDRFCKYFIHYEQR